MSIFTVGAENVYPFRKKVTVRNNIDQPEMRRYLALYWPYPQLLAGVEPSV